MKKDNDIQKMIKRDREREWCGILEGKMRENQRRARGKHKNSEIV